MLDVFELNMTGMTWGVTRDPGCQCLSYTGVIMSNYERDISEIGVLKCTSSCPPKNMKSSHSIYILYVH